MNSQELFDQMKALWGSFEENHNGHTKVSKNRARKAITNLRGLITEYRKTSIAESKE